MKTKEDRMVKIAKALSDKTRIELLKEIAEKGSISCGEAERVSSLSQPTISHHFKILTEADLLNTEKVGRHMIVSINQKTLDEFNSFIADSMKVSIKT